MDELRPEPTPDTPGRRPRAKAWVARFGVAGLIFFTVKGLLWLIVPALAAAGVFRAVG